MQEQEKMENGVAPRMLDETPEFTLLKNMIMAYKRSPALCIFRAKKAGVGLGLISDFNLQSLIT